jgi:hypothetical protein
VLAVEVKVKVLHLFVLAVEVDIHSCPLAGESVVPKASAMASRGSA